RLNSRDARAELLQNAAGVAARGVTFEDEQCLLERRVVWGRRPTNSMNAAYAGRFDGLVRGHQLLGELFARPQTDVGDRDLDVGDEAGEPDEVPRHVHDLDLGSHVEHISRAILAKGRTLEHELDVFGDEP